MSVESESVLVKLTRIEGKQDVTNERLETANKINDERHAWVKTHLGVIDTHLLAHSERLTGLEGRELGLAGERKGLLAGGKLVWAILGAIPGGAIVAVLLRLFQ